MTDRGTGYRRPLGRLVLVLATLGLMASAEAQQVVLQRAEAVRQVEAMGLATEGTVVTPEGTVTYSLQHLVNGIPLYHHTTNINAAVSVSTDKCRPGGTGGLALTGSGVTLGIWDAGAVLRNHVEFGGRATQRDSAVQTHFHATHVAGTMVGGGISPSALGMSPAAVIDCYDWDHDDAEMNSAALAGLRVSNHSYGFITGWQRTAIVPTGGEGDIDPIPVVNWTWFGDTRISQLEDYFFGYYSFEAKAWDKIAVDNPYYLFVKSAGNDRNQGPPPGTAHSVWDYDQDRFVVSTDTRNLDGNGGYDCISHASTAKNGLTVGAVNDVSGGYRSPSLVSMSSFSCWGPTDDGRIKPDIVGNGVQLYSATNTGNHAYTSLSGTSMSAPNVSGSLGLLIEHYRSTHPGEPDMLSSTLKGLIIGTADECGPAPGPDYQFGWGLLNTLKAAELLTQDQSMPLVVSEHTLFQGEEFELVVISDASAPQLRVTICWIDPVPTIDPPYALDPVDKMLVNDLDVRLLDGEDVNLPWILDVFFPSRAAIRGDNITDNVEQVVVENLASVAYRLRVSHKGNLAGGSQAFSLIIQGASSVTGEPERDPPMVAGAVPAEGSPIGGLSDIHVSFTEPVSGVAPENLMVNGSPASSVTGMGSGPYVFSGTWGPPDGTVQVHLMTGEVKDIFDNPLVSAEWNYAKRDCNGNRVHDSEDIAGQTSDDCNLNLIPDERDPAALKFGAYVERTIPFGAGLSLDAATMVSGGVPPITFDWTLRGSTDEQRSTSATPVFNPKQPGTYVARLVATDAMGCRAIGFMTIEVSEGANGPGGSPPAADSANDGFCPMAIGPAMLTMALAYAGRRARGSRRPRG